MGLLDYFARLGGDGVCSREVTLADGTNALLLINPTKIECGVAEQGEEYLIVVHTHSGESQLVVDVMPYAKLHLTQVVLADAVCRCEVRQQAGSECGIVSVVTAGATLDYTLDMNGSGAVSNLRSAFVVGASERARVGVRTNHNVSDCRSCSLVKGVAGGEAVGEFEGMVYVAPDAQRTDAQQTSRNIVLGTTSRIKTEPQLEIYADDVKCTHGATVGQLDSEAILYMRQRGLSEAQAKRLQIEGFVQDIVLYSGELCEALSEELTTKLESL